MLILIAAVLLILLMSMTTYEHMTNKDLMSALKKYGTEDEKDKKKNTPSEAPIYGPQAEPVAPTNSSSKTKLKPNQQPDTSLYPDIYGPDVTPVPGEKLKVNEDHYDYNPDFENAFPTNGPPQPFLTDFSKFQH